MEGGEPGLGLPDMVKAVTQSLDQLRTLLRPTNARQYLADLPQDVDVVSVEPVVRQPAHPQRYLKIA